MTVPKITVTLTGQSAEKLTQLMQSRGYDTPEAAVVAALDDMPLSEDPEIEAWLSEVVVPRLDQAERDPQGFLTADQLRANVLGND
jgi:hypothetical protein